MPASLAGRAVSETGRSDGEAGWSGGPGRPRQPCAAAHGTPSASTVLMQRAMPAAYIVEERAAGFEGEKPRFVVAAEVVERLA
ncbi:hypothetical protein BX591_11970 [Paraburkholderia bryophila]|jgi:hypothetical protein|uniref:Uncharacterized protein n=1 Tax=Paraburkholderia bryophila TaxID=420952 RepID=A0A329BMG6_9BURK|nr:hypothetical protein BX591_11970 [Paraburkholderia bryophila]